jgi:hypothetical protein
MLLPHVHGQHLLEFVGSGANVALEWFLLRVSHRMFLQISHGGKLILTNMALKYFDPRMDYTMPSITILMSKLGPTQLTLKLFLFRMNQEMRL